MFAFTTPSDEEPHRRTDYDHKRPGIQQPDNEVKQVVPSITEGTKEPVAEAIVATNSVVVRNC